MMGDAILRLWTIGTELLGIMRKKTDGEVSLTITITIGNVTATLYKSGPGDEPSVN